MNYSSPNFLNCTLLVADWSLNHQKRVVYEVNVANRLITRRNENNWTVENLCQAANNIINIRRNSYCLIAIDVAIGLPRRLFEHWTQNIVFNRDNFSLSSFLRNPPVGHDWLSEAQNVQNWNCYSPYIRVPPGNGSLNAFRNRANILGIPLERNVDVVTNGKSPLILSGIPGTVGSASRSVLQELLNIHGGEGWQNNISIWPFDGRLSDLVSNFGKVIIGEIYPRSLYGHVFDDRPPDLRQRIMISKTSTVRRLQAVQYLHNLTWYGNNDTLININQEHLNLAIDNEDDFDAYFSALGLLRLILEGQSLEDQNLANQNGVPLIDPIAEGGMLGLLGPQVGNRESNLFPANLDMQQPNNIGLGQPPHNDLQPDLPAVWTTERIINTGNLAIVSRGLPAGNRLNRQNVLIRLENGVNYQLVIGDTHNIWRAHHETPEQLADFDALFEILSENPGEQYPINIVE